MRLPLDLPQPATPALIDRDAQPDRIRTPPRRQPDPRSSELTARNPGHTRASTRPGALQFSQTVELCVGPDGERVDTGFPFGLIEIIPSEERLTISITRSYGGDLVAAATA